MTLSRRIIFCISASTLILHLACIGSSPTAPGSEEKGAAKTSPHFKPGFNLFSPQQDVEMGKQSATQIVRQMPVLNDSQITGYIRQLGAKLAAKAPGEKFPYTFNVIATKDVNAFALPGGFIFVNAGAIAAARNEGELAGVMAHEIMHVALRHGTSQASKAYLAKAGLGVLGSIASNEQSPGIASILASIGGAGANMLFLKFGRTAERQSDLAGARILAEAGYDPRDMAGFFKTLQQLSGERGQGVPEFMSDHPDPGNRIASIEEIYKSLPVSQTPVRETEEFASVKGRLTGRSVPLSGSRDLARVGPRDPTRIEPGTRPEGPSSEYRSFQSEDVSFGLEYPSNWQALSPAESNYIFAPRGGYGQAGGQLMVTHGIFVGLVPPIGRDLASANTLFIQKQLEDNPDFRIVRQPQAIDFSGTPGFVTVISGPSTSTGVMEFDVTYTTATADGRLFYLITICPEDEMPAYKAAFDRIISSLRLAR